MSKLRTSSFNNSTESIDNLKDIKNKFELILNNIEDFVWIMNKDLQISYASPSVFNLLGYTPEEFRNISLESICTPETKVKLHEAINKRLTGKSDPNKKQWEVTLVHKNQNIVWFDTITNPIFDEQGNFDGVIGVSRDISLKKEIEQQNKEIQANLFAQIENTNDYIWSIDLNYGIKTINSNFKQEFQNTFGATLNVGVNIIDRLPKALKATWTERYKRALAGERFSLVEEFIFKKQQIFLEITFNPIYIDCEISGVSCFSRDITQQKTTEKALIESEKKIKDFVSNIPSVSYQCINDEHWTMKFLSSEILNLTGYPPSDFIDNKKRSYGSIIYVDDIKYVKDRINTQIQKGESFNLRYRIVHKNRSIVWVQEWGRASFDVDGNIKTIDGVIADFSEQKIIEQQLIDNEDKFKTLSDASVEMLKLSSRNETLDYISKVLSEKLQNYTIIGSTLNEKLSTIQITSAKGLQADFLEKASAKCNVNLYNYPFNVSSKLIEKLKTGSIFLVDETLNFLSNNGADNLLFELIEPIIKNRNLYGIGITRDDVLLGSVWLLGTKYEIISDNGFVKSFINLASIVLKQQVLVEALHSSELKFREIFDQSNSAISIQTSSKILLVNKAWERITGYTIQDAETLSPKELIHPQSREELTSIADKRIVGEDVPSNYLFHLIDKQGKERWLDLSASLIEYEGIKCTLIIASDITQRKTDEHELIKLSTGIINSPSSILITDIDGNIEYVNPFFTEFTGYTFEEVKGKNPRILQSGNTPIAFYKELWNTILSGEVWSGEFENRKKNGDIYWESARIAPILDDNGIVISFIAIKVDITEKIRSLAKIEKSELALKELNAKKDKFFSIIAHDLRSPFSALVGLTDILQKNHKVMSDREVDNYLNLLNQSAQNVFKLLENLLSWAKTQTGRIEFNPVSINVHDLAQETIDIIALAANNKEIVLENHIPMELRLDADRNMLLTIFRNLLSNALKYTNRNGIVKIGAKPDDINGSGIAKIWVADNGVGIPKDKIHKLFRIEEIYTTKGTEKEKGTGLGLILCKEFLELHKGSIWVESDEGIGTTFSFSMPSKQN
ncbi:MAG: PAS domain S-box protein [Salinivirgaceae bacterium]|nr:PAS domain S-box protein [Salinivirgaceae bacterium]